jgi:DNA replication and repair protein RecF
MILKSLLLHNFRSYALEKISFLPRINGFLGANGQGKTNLLEAIYLLSTGRSFRTPHLQELIQEGKKFFFVEAEIQKDGLDQTLSLYFDGKEKRFCHQKCSSSSFSSLLGIMPSIIHAPHDRELISGQPSLRRRFLNLHLSQEDPLYIHHLSRYCQALKQRNFLLKAKNTKTIAPWEEEMALSAVYLTEKRKLLIKELNELLPLFLGELTQNEEIEIRYLPSCSSEPLTPANYQELLEKNRARELHFGATQVGPHRDDWLLFFQKKEASTHASEGQKKSFLLALRLAEWKRLSQKFEEPILMNLDDVAIHLDLQRQSLLKPLLSHLHQVFFTAPSQLLEGEKNLVQNYLVENGSVRALS